MLMQSAPDLRVLFPTDLSDACVQASKAIAQLADALILDITIVHVVRPASNGAVTRRALEGFFPEARQIGRCRRVLVEASDACKAITQLCEAMPYDLVVAPDTGHLKPRNLVSGSFRARLLRRNTVPLWTAGGCLRRAAFHHGIRTIACLVDFDDRPEALLPQVAAFANHFGARVQALAVLPPIDDAAIGEMAQSETPLRPAAASSRIEEMFGGDAPADIDVAVGARGGELPRLLTRCKADLLFVGPRQSAPGPWRFRFSRYLDRLPCPVVCVSDPAGLTGRAFHRAAAATAGREAALVVAS